MEAALFPKETKRLVNGRYASNYQKYWDNKILQAKKIEVENRLLKLRISNLEATVKILSDKLENNKPLIKKI